MWCFLGVTVLSAERCAPRSPGVAGRVPLFGGAVGPHAAIDVTDRRSTRVIRSRRRGPEPAARYRRRGSARGSSAARTSIRGPSGPSIHSTVIAGSGEGPLAARRGLSRAGSRTRYTPERAPSATE